MTGQLRNLLRAATLRPYGRNLLTPGAALWFLFMTILVTVMALIEGFAWGSISRYLLPGSYRPIAFAVGLIVFFLIWIYDTSFVVLDMSGLPSSERRAESRRQMLTDLFRRLLSSRQGRGAIFRIILVVFSLWVTMPLLTQVFLTSDINEELVHQRGQIRSELIVSVNKVADPRIAELSRRLVELRSKFTAEVAGKGPSGKYGKGPVAEAIQQQIRATEADIRRLQQEKEDQIKFIESADAALISKRYGVSLLGDTFSNRWQILQSMLAAHDNAQFRILDWLAKAFLGIIFIAILGLKILQPRSVDMYLNESLQDMYMRYLTGAFNDRIERDERPKGPSPMTPYRFQEWVHNTYTVQETHDRRVFLRRAFERGRQRLREDREELSATVAPLKARFSSLHGTEAELALKEMSHLQQQRELNRKIDKNNQDLERLRNEVGSSDLPAGFRREIALQAVELSSANRRLSTQIDTLNVGLGEIRAQLDTLRDDLRALGQAIERDERLIELVMEKERELTEASVMRVLDDLDLDLLDDFHPVGHGDRSHR